MSIFLSDLEIQELKEEPKIVNQHFNDFFNNLKQREGHKESDYSIIRMDGSQFRIKIRQSTENILDFSAILAFIPKNSNSWFILTRYNGKSHEHKNKLEKEPKFYDYHIHIATERYQNIGAKVEHYAKQTNRYSDIKNAFTCLIQDWNLILQKEPQLKLFNE